MYVISLSVSLYRAVHMELISINVVFTYQSVEFCNFVKFHIKIFASPHNITFRHTHVLKDIATVQNKI